MDRSIDLWDNSCGTGILPVQNRCLIIALKLKPSRHWIAARWQVKKSLEVSHSQLTFGSKIDYQ
jgi:hypothetical protein